MRKDAEARNEKGVALEVFACFFVSYCQCVVGELGVSRNRSFSVAQTAVICVCFLCLSGVLAMARRKET